MSYILDALKKSQNTRGQPEPRVKQQVSQHFLEDKKVSRGATSDPQTKSTVLSRWLWVIVLALTVNGSITLYHHLSDPQHGAPELHQAATDVVPTLRTRELTENTLTSTSNRPEKDTSPESSGTLRLESQPAATSVATEVETTVPTGATRVASQQNRIDASSPPFLWQKSAGFQQKIPDMNIDMLFYTAKGPQRFVFVNMRKLREGERITKDIVLTEIRANELVLSYRGELFRVMARR